MKISRRLAHIVIAMIGFSSLADRAYAAMIAYDNAGDSAYNSGTVIGVNGGYGWGGPWSANLGLYLRSSSLLGGPDPGTGYINSPKSPDGRAWGVGTFFFTGAPPTTTASRPFSGPLTPGQTFSIDIDDSPGANAGITLGDLAVGMGGFINNVPVYQAQSTAGPNGSLVVDFGAPVTDFGARAEFTVLNDSTTQVTITSLAPGGDSDSFILPYSTTMTGMLAQNFPWGQGSGFLYLNNMSITPEPDTAALAIVALSVVLLGQRSRARRPHWLWWTSTPH